MLILSEGIELFMNLASWHLFCFYQHSLPLCFSPCLYRSFMIVKSLQYHFSLSISALYLSTHLNLCYLSSAESPILTCFYLGNFQQFSTFLTKWALSVFWTKLQVLPTAELHIVDGLADPVWLSWILHIIASILVIYCLETLVLGWVYTISCLASLGSFSMSSLLVLIDELD